MKRKVIIDTDPGVDDALAIMAALSHPELEVLGITTVAGNKGIKTTTGNAAGLSTYFGGQVKVYKGAEKDSQSVKEAREPREDASSVHGETGLGSVHLPVEDTVVSGTDAVSFILETVKQYPDEVDIIALAPLTNLYHCIQEDLETMKKVRSIHSMGGGIHRGNVTPVAEFNYWFDPYAVDEVYLKLGNHLPIYMVGLDITHAAITDFNDFGFMKLVGAELGSLIEEMFQHYIKAYWENNQYIGCAIHDLVVMIGYFYPEIYPEKQHTYLRCVTDSKLAYGQCIADLRQKTTESPNAWIPLSIDVPLYKEKVIEGLFGKKNAQLYKKTVLSL